MPLSPNNIKSNCSLVSSLIGLSKLILYLRANCFTCVKTLASLAIPNGATPPSLILNALSGIISDMSIEYTLPKPLQVGHAP